jgi:hypothetical protein
MILSVLSGLWFADAKAWLLRQVHLSHNLRRLSKLDRHNGGWLLSLAVKPAMPTPPQRKPQYPLCEFAGTLRNPRLSGGCFH